MEPKGDALATGAIAQLPGSVTSGPALGFILGEGKPRILLSGKSIGEQ